MLKKFKTWVENAEIGIVVAVILAVAFFDAFIAGRSGEEDGDECI